MQVIVYHNKKLEISEEEKNQILADFDKKINPFLEEMSQMHGIEKHKMCSIAYKLFTEIPEPSIRKKVAHEFKDHSKDRETKPKTTSYSSLVARLKKLPKKIALQAIEEGEEIAEMAKNTHSFVEGVN
jgi:hypothetical protein